MNDKKATDIMIWIYLFSLLAIFVLGIIACQ